MPGPTDNPFAAIEERLVAPPADGVFLTVVPPDSPFAAAGVAAGDVIVRVGGADVAPDWGALLRALQPGPDAAAELALAVHGADGRERRVGVARAALAGAVRAGLRGCNVRRGVAAWDPRPDPDDAPDFSGLAPGTRVCLRNSLGAARAGYEVLEFGADGDRITTRVAFALGGDDGRGGTWLYRSRVESTHVRDRVLSTLRTAFFEGDELALRGDVRLEEGRWRGVRAGPGGVHEPVDFEAATLHGLVPYAATALPLTMAQREGAAVTFCALGEGTGRVSERGRMVCVGRRAVDVAGRSVDAWCYEWRHYGDYGENELFYVDDARRLVRVEWGANYGHCWGESVPERELMDGVPPGLTAP